LVPLKARRDRRETLEIRVNYDIRIDLITYRTKGRPGRKAGSSTKKQALTGKTFTHAGRDWGIHLAKMKRWGDLIRKEPHEKVKAGKRGENC